MNDFWKENDLDGSQGDPRALGHPQWPRQAQLRLLHLGGKQDVYILLQQFLQIFIDEWSMFTPNQRNIFFVQ